VRTTAGSKILADFVPAEDATVVSLLRRAGAIVVGKTNLHEFAYGVTTENPHYGPARNPWDTRRMTGGSSGGSAAALGAGIGWGSLGSDTGGSVRIPPSLCGVVGLKPTFGRVSCHGVVPLALHLDHLGPMATSVTGAAWLLGAIAGRDRRDRFTRSAPAPAADYAASFGRRLGRVRIGLPRAYFFDGIDPEVAAAVAAATRRMERLGAKLAEVDLGDVARSVEIAAEIAFAEARHFHGSAGYFPARSGDYGEDVRRLLERGEEIRAYAYLAHRERMREAREGWNRAIEGFDALLAPATPIAAPEIGQKLVRISGREETVRAALLRLCRPANFTGAPALVLPCGFTRSGLPIGLQLMGPLWSEARLLRIGYAYEQATEWRTRHPSDL
jgi:aspartyl-tRNA(Asn)/glutamyl-tRNA(Gln) amidotransferase subunit A